jgi:VCBS repeat-containing protein
MLALRLRAPLALAFACCFHDGHAQISIQNGSSVTENFDALGTAATGNTILPNGWRIAEAGGSSGTGSNVDGTYRANDGALNTGDTYSYGATGSGERALGMLRSGTLVSTIGAELVNTGSSPITSLEVSFTGEQWRLGTADRGADRLDFEYSTDATSLTTGTWTGLDGLDFIGPVTTGALGARDGNVAANRVARTATIGGLNLAQNQRLWVRWVDVEISGADDGLAIDDVRFGQAVDNPPSVASTSPLPNATSVALDAEIVVAFDEPVATSGNWFALDCGASTPALSVAGGPTAYTFTHAAPLPSGADCTLTLENTLVVDLDGTAQAMSQDYVLPFKAAVDVAPTLVSTTPIDGASNVSRGADLLVTFSEPVDFDSAAFALECPAGNAVTLLATSDDNVVTLDPQATLSASTLCRLLVDAAHVTDRDGIGHPLASSAAITFTTAAMAPPAVVTTVPADGATNFPPAGDLVVTFDQNVTLGANALALACDTSSGIVLTHASAGTSFTLETGTALVDGESCTLHIEADAIASDDGLHPATDLDIVFAIAAADPDAYYATVNTSSPGQLRCTLHAVIDGHQYFPYTSSSTDTWDILEIADEDPLNRSNILEVYRNQSIPKAGGGGGYDREHTWPKSLGFPNESQHAHTDTHMLHLSYPNYNSARSNSPYGYCPPSAGCGEKPTLAYNGHGGGSGTYPGNSNWNTGSLFEVWNFRKGNMARAVMYMAIRYEGGDGVPDLELTDNEALIVQHSGTDPKAYMGLLSDLLAWHQADPPDAQEVIRNGVVQGFQGNRNPFIDHPEWATAALFTSTTPATCQPNGGGNVAPVAVDDQFSATEDATLSQPFPGVLGNDSDANNNIMTAMRTANAQHGNVALAGNGSFTYTPAADYCGPDGFSYQASDGALNSATALVTLNVGCVNDAPVANDANFGLAENSGNGTPVGTVTAGDVDAGAALTYAITAGNGSNAFAISNSGAITVANAAALDFETTPAFALTVTVTDNASASDTANVAIALSNVDEGAAQAANDAVTVNEDASATAIDVLDNDSADPDGGALVVTTAGAAQHGTTSFTAADVSYAPSADFCGADEFTYTIGGGATATVSVTVTCVIDAPEAIGVIADRNVTVDRPLAAFSVAGAFSSPDEAPTFEADGLPAGVAIVAATGEISGTPTAVGAFAVTVRAVNSAGNAQAGFTLTVQDEPIFRDGFED